MLRGFFALTGLLGFLAVGGASDRPPNVLVLLADDQGWGDLSQHGNRNLATPNLDSLARDGVQAARFYVQPVCAPTRAEFLTGRYHPRGRVLDVTSGGERLALSERTIANRFQAAGYATGYFGKWHNGSQYPFHPLGRGFEEFYGFTSGHWGDYFSPPLNHNGRPVTGSGFLADDLTSRAITFLTTAQKPVFCVLAFNTPHSPMQVPDEDWDRLRTRQLLQLGGKQEDLNHTRAALAMCENLDKNVGRVLRSLDENQLAADTIIVYFSDNGPNGHRWNGGLKGIKGSTDEGGVRSPLFVRWPGRIPAGTTLSTPAAAIDLLPTLCELAGVAATDGPPRDGVSLAPVLLGTGPPPAERLLFAHWRGRVSVCDNTFRLDAAARLYDLTADPNQTQDVRAQHPAVAERLQAAVERWKTELLTEQKQDEIQPFPVGYVEMPRTELPARDGVPTGKVRRSASAPNCSFFENWVASSDRMTWAIDVHTAGQYEAVLHYTCPAADVGSAIELKAGQTTWAGVVKIPFDPPFTGAKNDRVPRVGESDTKLFRPLRLGVQRLEAGRTQLILAAPQVAGRTVADVRAVELILVP